MTTDEEIENLIDKLEECADYEGSEQGESWRNLCYLWKYNYCCSEDFKNALKQEIILQAKEIDENYEIVEEEITKTYKQTLFRRKYE
jgi:hypothetical protein